jgi:branched-chain amino acid transport system permease protein
MAIREDEVAAKAMGINTRNLKLLAFGMGATFGGVSGAMFATFQGFISPESFSLQESTMIVAMVVLGGLGHLPGVIVGALLLSALPEVLRYVAGPLQQMTDGRLDASILRQLLIAVAMIGIMLARPRGLWPSPEHGRDITPDYLAGPSACAPERRTSRYRRPSTSIVPTANEQEPRSMSETILNVGGVSKRFGGLQALSDVGIKIEKGQVYGLIGRTAPARRPSSTC